MADVLQPDLLNTDVVQLHDTRAMLSAFFVGQTLFIYDTLLTWADEYQYIWMAKWSTGKVLYILIRYPFNFVFFVVIMYKAKTPSPIIDAVYGRVLLLESLGGTAQSVLIETVLCLRTTALYNMDKRVVAFLYLLGALCIGATLLLQIFFTMGMLSRIDSNPLPSGVSPWCKDDRLWRSVHIPFIIFDTAVFLLTLQKHRQESKRSAETRSPLMRILYRDGFIYYIVICGCSIANIILFNITRCSLAPVLAPIVRAMPPLMTARMLLNLRGEFLRQPSGSIATTGFSIGQFQKSSHAFVLRSDPSPADQNQNGHMQPPFP